MVDDLGRKSAVPKAERKGRMRVASKVSCLEQPVVALLDV